MLDSNKSVEEGVQLALLFPCPFTPCSAPRGVSCKIEECRKDAGIPSDGWKPYWERGVHYMRMKHAREKVRKLAPLELAILKVLSHETR